MDKLFKEHRYLGKIDSGIKKGYPIYFLYGQGINDYSFFDTHLGIRKIEKSLFLYFYNVQKVDAFAVVKNGNVTFFDSKGKEVSTNNALNIQKEITGFGCDCDKLPSNDNEEDEDSDKNAQDATNGMTSFENDLNYIEEHYNDKKIAVYFDEFEWEANLYATDQNLELLRRVKNWNKSKKSFTIVSIKDPDLLKEFGFDLNETADNIIYLGNPSHFEISKAYRRYIGTKRPDVEIVEYDFEDIVSAIQASKKNLRESMRVLKLILNDCPKNAKLTKELFKYSFTKTIEEKVTFDDVILDEKIKKQILQKVKTFHTDKENKSKGLIMYGPPGTGKTYIAKAIAHEYQMNYIAPTLADLKGEFIGQTSGKVKRLFEEARANAPTIMFLDEIDTIFTKRGGSDGDSYLRDMVNQFLVEIDGAKTGEQDVFIIGATNRLDIIDPAIRSRLPDEFLIGLPDEVNRMQIFDSKFKEFKLSEQEWAAEFIKRTEGMSGRDIENFTKNIKEKKLVEKDLKKYDFYNVLQDFENRFIEDFKRDLQGSIKIEDDVEIKFKDVIGYEEVKNTLKHELDYILSDNKQKKVFSTFGIEPKRGNLLYGPPGNGKTTFAEALAGEHDFYYIKILSKDFAGYSSIMILENLELIFANTVKLSKMTNKAGVVLFFDEIDTLISMNMDSTVRGTLLNFFEDKKGIKSVDSKVVLIAATNFKIALDEASIREGRFDSKLEIGYPQNDVAIEMLKNFFTQDDHLELFGLEDEYYRKLYASLVEKKEQDIKKDNSKIKNEDFHKVFEGISVVELKGEKERIKAVAFYSDIIEEDKIIIKNHFSDKQ